VGADALHHLSVDIETFSDVDIQKAGLYKYAQSPAFRILLFAYSLDGAPVQVVDLTQRCAVIPPEIAAYLLSDSVVKHAYNASFEWYCLSRYFDMGRPEAWLSQWRCTMLHGMYLGYPGGLDACGKALGLPQDKQKMAVGKSLIRYFCVPCKPTKANGGRTVNLPHHDPLKWDLFKTYNGQDVVTEMEIENRLSAYPVPDEVQKQWELDLTINARGVAVDTALVASAQAMDAEVRKGYTEEAGEITGIENPNSIRQLMEWFTEQNGEPLPDMSKSTVNQMLKADILPEKVRRMLEIRQELGKTSNKKYDSLAIATCDDGRVRGLLQFYGANRTGRWAGRIVQPQNLPRTYIHGELLPMARDLVKAGNTDALKWIFGSVPDTLSQLIRTAFVASPGNMLLDADFSAIEARVIAWLADEEWVLEVFRTHGKIYEATASQMFNIPIERIKKGQPEYAYRQKGKVATLALGYQGGVGAMRTMDTGHELDSLSDDEVQELVDLWRKANPNIVKLWGLVEAAAKAAITEGRTSFLAHGITVSRCLDPQNGLDFMVIGLPSGRRLYYPQPAITQNRFGRPSVSYMGQNQTTKKWERIETYGGKLVENIVQAVARDCLAESITRLEDAGYRVVFHIHDEIVVDSAGPGTSLERMEQIMSEPPAWALGLPLNADGWVNEFFKKD
jgi:DNA polymerase